MPRVAQLRRVVARRGAPSRLTTTGRPPRTVRHTPTVDVPVPLGQRDPAGLGLPHGLDLADVAARGTATTRRPGSRPRARSGPARERPGTPRRASPGRARTATGRSPSRGSSSSDADLAERRGTARAAPSRRPTSRCGRRTAARPGRPRATPRAAWASAGLDQPADVAPERRCRWRARWPGAARPPRPSATSSVGQQRPAAGGGRGEHLLGAAVVLVRAPAGDDGDPEAGDDDGRDRQHGGQQRVLERAGAADALDHLPAPGRSRAGRRRRERWTPMTVPSAARRRSSRAAPACAPARSARARRPAAASRAPARAGPANSPEPRSRAGPERLRGDRERRRPGRRTAAAPTSAARTTRAAWVFQPNGVSQLSHVGADVPDGAHQVEHAEGRRRRSRSRSRLLADELAAQRGDARPRPGRSRPGRTERRATRRPAARRRCPRRATSSADDRRRATPSTRAAASGASPADRGAARAARRGRTPPRCGCAGGRRPRTSAPRTRRTAPSSWSSPARPGCARRGSARRARPPRGWR